VALRLWEERWSWGAVASLVQLAVIVDAMIESLRVIRLGRECGSDCQKMK
jgi:hypothetical protein